MRYCGSIVRAVVVAVSNAGQEFSPRRLIADDHSTRGQQCFDIPEAETEAMIEPHGMANALGWKPMILIAGRD